MKKVNYHTHTMRCHHAAGKDEEYIQAAIRGGYEVLGFSDHACWKYDSAYVSGIRMELSQFQEYYESLSELKEKYQKEIQIFIGLECEYFPKYMDWIQGFAEEQKLDYVIFGNHFSQTDETGVYYGTACKEDLWLKRYIEDCIAGLSTGFYSYLAHPDLFMRVRPQFDTLARQESERLCQWCKEQGVILEYNLEGLQMRKEGRVAGYPHEAFWEIAAKTGNQVIIGVDAHKPISLERTDSYDQAKRFLEELGVSLTDRIPLRTNS